MEEKISRFGNVEFTKDGVLYQVPYKEPNWDSFEKVDMYKILTFTKELVKGRLEHCIEELNKNISSNIGITVDGRVFYANGGHFSKKAAECMQKVLECSSIKKMNMGMTVQALKACINPKVVFDDKVVECTNSESQIKMVSEVLIDHLCYIEQGFRRAASHGLENEFSDAMNGGLSVDEALKEWDI